MKKSDLKNRMVVETREGERYIVAGDEILSETGWNRLSYYSEDLTNELHKELDIVRVYREIVTLEDIDSKNLKLLWERKWKPEKGEVYYIPDAIYSNLFLISVWSGDDKDSFRLEQGLIFKTKEEAIECAKKMLEVVKG